MTDASPSPPVVRAGLVVALDGPASSGKSSVGSHAAERLGYRFVDTGLLYRGVTWLAQQLRVPLDLGDSVAELVPRVALRAGPDGRFESVIVDGMDVTDEVLSPVVDRHVSEVARQPEVRKALLGRQRDLAGGGSIVVAGRDIGTVVLPDADVKIYLEASPEERARRRAEQRGFEPDSPEAAAILGDLRRRDHVDRTRETAPLRAAPDALVVATDGIGLDQTVAVVVDAVRAAEMQRADLRRAEDERAAQLADAEQAALDLAAAEMAATPIVSAPATPTAAEPAAVGGEPDPPRSPAPRPSSGATAPPPLDDHVTPFIRLTDWVGRTIMRSVTRVHIEGLEQPLEIDGPLIVASNHASNADGVLVACWLTPALGRRIYLIGKQEALDVPLMGWALRQNGLIGVRRGAADLEAFRAAKRVLDEGHVLGLFPEGTRSPDGRLQEAKEGAAILALRTGAPILPVGISGTYRFWPRQRKMFRLGGHVRMRVGEPFRLPQASGADRRRLQGEATRMLMARIAALLPPAQRGVYSEDVDRLPEG